MTLKDEKIVAEESIKEDVDPYLVSWDGTEDPKNPHNWRASRKWAQLIVVSNFALLGPFASSMIAPCLDQISQRFNITNSTERALVLSIYLLAFAISPMISAPLSEVFGRRMLLQYGNVIFVVFNMACGLATNKTQMYIFRFLAGFGSATPMGLGSGTISDLFYPSERGKAVAVMSLAPLLGPTVGPVIGGFIAQYTTYKWIFWSSTILSGSILLVSIPILRETYPKTLLAAKARLLNKEAGHQKYHTEWGIEHRPKLDVISEALMRPVRMVFTQPLVIICSGYMAIQYGILYLVLTTFPILWTQHYHETPSIAGLNYIASGIGLVLGSQASGVFIDKVFRYLRAKHNGKFYPEFRVPIILLGTMFFPTGLFVYGWTAEKHTHWIGPDIGAAMFNVGLMLGWRGIQVYLIDTYIIYAASSTAVACCVRSVAAFAFPLFGQAMYDKMGYGWGNSLLAFVVLGSSIIVCTLLWFFSKFLRSISSMTVFKEP
ncbi:membrane transporter [Schizosaccharomyces japonicus yFS275]|uniref:Membrane transporter n=1 Tax=Schizosaccharomyces japonicus (strain yFS275 / FY16936) TaxID=402676 RepID=B6K551_SCHJY|nr:membrane transporter [Schizosaccharomyces japonicus yFS275]EEB08655.1 membrane transporter [Schizosaccharomyces japonicus yFS275]